MEHFSIVEENQPTKTGDKSFSLHFQVSEIHLMQVYTYIGIWLATAFFFIQSWTNICWNEVVIRCYQSKKSWYHSNGTQSWGSSSYSWGHKLCYRGRILSRWETYHYSSISANIWWYRTVQTVFRQEIDTRSCRQVYVWTVWNWIYWNSTGFDSTTLGFSKTVEMYSRSKSYVMNISLFPRNLKDVWFDLMIWLSPFDYSL